MHDGNSYTHRSYAAFLDLLSLDFIIGFPPFFLSTLRWDSIHT